MKYGSQMKPQPSQEASLGLHPGSGRPRPYFKVGNLRTAGRAFSAFFIIPEDSSPFSRSRPYSLRTSRKALGMGTLIPGYRKEGGS